MTTSAGRIPTDLLIGVLSGNDIDLPDDPAVARGLTEVGLGGLAYTVASAGPGRDRLRPGAIGVALLTELRIEALGRTRTLLAAEGIPSLALRGAALVEAELYPRSEVGRAARPMSDVDLLIPRRHGERAVAVLEAAGAESTVPFADRAFDWLDAHTLHLGEGRAATTVDLHVRVSRGGLRFGAPGLEDELRAETRESEERAVVPDPSAHLVHLAEHLLRHLRSELHLLGWADLVRLASRGVDWVRVQRLASKGPLAPGVAAVLDRIRRFGGSVPAELPIEIARAAGSRLGPALLNSVDPVHRLASGPLGRVAGLGLRWSWAGGGVRAAREFASAAVPHSEWLAARYPGVLPPFRAPRLWAEGVGWILGFRTSPVSGNQALETPPGSRLNPSTPLVDTPGDRF